MTAAVIIYIESMCCVVCVPKNVYHVCKEAEEGAPHRKSNGYHVKKAAAKHRKGETAKKKSLKEVRSVLQMWPNGVSVCV